MNDNLSIILETLSFPIKGSYYVLEYIKEFEKFEYSNYKVTKKEGKLFEIGSINKQIVYLDPNPLLDLNCIYDLENNIVLKIERED